MNAWTVWPSLLTALLQSLAGSPGGGSEGLAKEASAALEPGADVVARGPGLPPLYLPRGERLEFSVDVQITIIEAAVADCVMTSNFEPFRPPLLMSGGKAAEEGGEAEETAVLSLHATGEHFLYSMDALLETRRQPQDWPEVVHRLTQKGTEQRRRVTLLGVRNGVPTSSFRRDTSRGAPRGRRVWVEPVMQEVPEGTLDMLSGIYLIRTLIREGLNSIEFPMANKNHVWNVVLRRGAERVLKTAAGRFRAVEVLLETQPDPGSEEDGAEFEGPFGLKGTIHLWVEATTGVPVLISGDLPAGILTLGVEIGLESYEGTPPAFQPLPR